LKLFTLFRVALLRRHDQDDGDDDRGARADRRPRDLLPEEQRPERDCDHGIDERVRRDRRDAHVLQ
jgi:hypothetical protein